MAAAGVVSTPTDRAGLERVQQIVSSVQKEKMQFLFVSQPMRAFSSWVDFSVPDGDGPDLHSEQVDFVVASVNHNPRTTRPGCFSVATGDVLLEQSTGVEKLLRLTLEQLKTDTLLAVFAQESRLISVIRLWLDEQSKKEVPIIVFQEQENPCHCGGPLLEHTAEAILNHVAIHGFKQLRLDGTETVSATPPSVHQ